MLLELAFVQWMPERNEWLLKCKGVEQRAERVRTYVRTYVYCNEHGLNLTVPDGFQDQEYKLSHEKAFQDACLIWNALDQSKKPHIKLIYHPLKGDIEYMPAKEPGCYSDPEPHGEKDDEEE